ncbi:hypothetical protein BJ944DRAFT_274216 [Cunninghamella echinulata]|nr:hypothetical protein BJ944DRAFT_274216 [Cunninghamella echinulata]
MPSIALVTQPIEMKTSSYHPHYNPSNTTATTTPTYFNDPWTMTVNLTLNDAICQDWLYKYETPTFAFSRSWKRRYVVLLDKTVYIFKSSHHSQHHYKKFYTTSSSSSFSTTTPPIPSDRFLLTEDTLVFVSQEFKKGCVIELRKPLCKWYLRCESIDQMKCWLKILKKVVACIKLNYPSPLTTKLISNLSLTDDARLLIPKSSSSSPSSSSTPYSFQQQLLQQQQQQQQLQEQLQQRSHSQRLSPLSKRLLSYSKKRNSTPPTLLQQQQQQPFIALPPISFLDNNNNNTPKRQSLTQIPHWEKTLPPALPPPTSLPPPPPTTASSPSPRIMTRSFSTGSTSIKKRSNESLSPIQLPTVVETWGDSIDPSFK